MKRSLAPRKSIVLAAAAVAAVLVSLLAIPANPAAGRTTITPMSWLTCSRPLAPSRGLPASLKGWYSRQNKYITNRINLDERVLARKSVQLTQWGPDPCSGKVKVYLTHYSQAAARILIARYGNDVVVSHHSMPRPVPASRVNDVSPFNGGDFIVLGLAECTGGPIVEDNTTNGALMLTAGHCDRLLGDLVLRSDRSGNLGPEMGVVNAVRFCNNCIDAGDIRHDSTGARYNLKVWGGGDNSGTSYNEDGSCFPQPGDLVTQDSAFTGEVTGISVENVNQSITLTDGNTIVETTLAFKSSQNIIQGGDSGGPWMQHIGSSSEVCIVGTSEAEPGSCAGGPCLFGYYEQINAIDEFFKTHVPSS